MSKIFISYSRKDKDFVKKLYEALTKSLPNSDQDVWVDWEDIPPMLIGGKKFGKE